MPVPGVTRTIHSAPAALRAAPRGRTRTLPEPVPPIVRPSRAASLAVLLAAALAGSSAAITRSIELVLGAVSGPGFAAKAIRLELDGTGLARAKLRIQQLEALEHRWHDVTVSCSAFRLERSVIACDDGRLDGPASAPLAFQYDLATGGGRLVLTPGAGERWQLELTGGAERRAVLTFSGAPVGRLHDVVPELPIKLSAGTADGVLRAEFGARGRAQVEGETTLREVAFSDAAGLRAGEGIAGRIALHALAERDVWRWRIDAAWSAGEMYWSPVYSKAGYRLTANGALTPGVLEVEHATLAADGLGEARASASWDRAARRFARARAETGELAAAPLYARFLKPLLGETAFGELQAEGRLRASASWQDGRLAAGELVLEDLSVEDARGRFALFGVYAALPWQDGARTEGRIGMAGAELQRLPIGAVGAALAIGPEDVRADRLAIPVLTGLLTLSDLRLRNAADGLAWQVRGDLSPVPLDLLLAHFGLPAMQGSVAGEIPELRYERSTLRVDGTLLMRVFDGTVTVTDLVVDNPLGLAPRLHAHLDARALDLERITRTFSFGYVTGKVDARIDGLALSNWRPVRFDARIESSPGDYRKRISQKAVKSISALGGAGAAEAMQRGVLRFFDTFGYSKLGMTCTLRNGVCRMGGVEDLPQGYVLVKGGGVPALSVLGYNRDVGWEELVTRLKRVIDSNVEPTIQ